MFFKSHFPTLCSGLLLCEVGCEMGSGFFEAVGGTASLGLGGFLVVFLSLIGPSLKIFPKPTPRIFLPPITAIGNVNSLNSTYIRCTNYNTLQKYLCCYNKQQKKVSKGGERLHHTSQIWSFQRTRYGKNYERLRRDMIQSGRKHCCFAFKPIFVVM